MATPTQQGYLVIADISGYTSYVAATELEHAQAVLGELLELLVERVQPLLTLAKLEGDAVFSYAPTSRLTRGEAVVELIESTYVAFRDRVDGIQRRTTCDCRACHAIPTLDLKFLVHAGDYFIQHVAGINELVGSDVNLVHRLTKNGIAEATGWRGYALFTGAALTLTGLAAEGLHAQSETYDHLGEVKTYTMDLRSRYQELVSARQVIISPEAADAVIVVTTAAPRAVVWDWLNDPQKRALWEELDIRPLLRPGGRTAVGARNHCVHGKDAVSVETILDWRPYDYFTVEKASPPVILTVTSRLEATADGGTRLTNTTKLTGLPRPFQGTACKLIIRFYGIDKRYEKLAQMLSDELASKPQTLAPTPVLAIA